MRKAGTLESTLGVYTPWLHWQIEYENARGFTMQRYFNQTVDGRFCKCCMNVHYDPNWQFEDGALCPVCAANTDANGASLCSYAEHYNTALAKREQQLQEVRSLRLKVLSLADLEEQNIYVPPGD